MQVEKCRLISYCHGVSETLKKAEKCLTLASKQGVDSYSIGNLIHNEHVVSYFKNHGMKFISKPEDGKPGIALIRAHGMPDAEREPFEKAGYRLIDSTCSYILKTLKKMDSAVSAGRTILVLGEKKHAETLTLMGHGTSHKYLADTYEDVDVFMNAFSKTEPVSVIVQTTFSQDLYESFCDRLKAYFEDVVFENKLCQACLQRKKYSLELAEKCGCMVVVGTRTSSNSKELASWLERSGKPVYMFSDAADVDRLSEDELRELASYGSVGVCSGTSAPNEIIDGLCERLEKV